MADEFIKIFDHFANNPAVKGMFVAGVAVYAVIFLLCIFGFIFILHIVIKQFRDFHNF